jgi:hypothetical protein
MATRMTRDDRLKLAIRVYPQPRGGRDRRGRKLKHWRRPRGMFVFDTETCIDTTQSLMFGSYRYFIDGHYVEEGLFRADDLGADELATLQRYAATHRAQTDRRGRPELDLLTREAFLNKLYEAAYNNRDLIVGVNLPFDLSRISNYFASARDRRFAGGFSLALWEYTDRDGVRHINRYRPRIAIKHIDSKRALKGFTGTFDADPVDLIPEDSETGNPEDDYKFRGHFLDLRTLAFVLTDRGHSLASACEAFDTKYRKGKTEEHGIITPEYIDYNRQDVAASAALAFKLLEEYDRFDVPLQETQAYSPASLGKAHLRKMGIAPVLERRPDFPKYFLGAAETAFFGGRTSAHIRKVPVPVVYTDFLSMYPTVNVLMGLWKFVVAREVSVVQVEVSRTIEFLRTITPEKLFDPQTWSKLPAFVRVVPDGDVLPTRAKYSLESNDYQVAVNYLYSENADHKDGLWYALPDVVASVLLTGKVPHIVEAFEIVPIGTLPTLRPITLRETVPIDPGSDDFFKRVIEERKRLAKNTALPEQERDRLDKALKVLANATSYGIFAEMRREESAKKIAVTCYGLDSKPFECKVLNPERPGEYCFPPLASLITAAARLMLALLERCVTDLGGTYAMEDTDSMAIVATKRGGLIECPGGLYRKNDKFAIKTLSWRQVNEISERFKALNPYDLPGSALEIEKDNFDPHTGKQRQLWCLAISAKRYALYLREADGEPELLRKGVNNKSDRFSEHGLGHLMNPSDPRSEDKKWIAAAWVAIIRKSLGIPPKALRFGKRMAVGRITVSSPSVMKAFSKTNKGKPYASQIKPFNFIVSCHVRKLGHPISVDPEQFHLIAPYETNAHKWDSVRWTNQYTNRQYRVSASAAQPSRTMARVKSYADILEDYEYHPESKCADANGAACGKQSVGLLGRRHAVLDGITYIGKESNNLEDVEAETTSDVADVYTEYPDPGRDEWETKWLPMLQVANVKELEECGVSRATIYAVRSGRPLYSKTKANLIRILSAKTKQFGEPDV